MRAGLCPLFIYCQNFAHEMTIDRGDVAFFLREVALQKSPAVYPKN